MSDTQDTPLFAADNPDATEADVQRRIFAEFNAARKAGDTEEAERIARMFLAHPWREPPGTSGAFAMRMFVERTDATRREKAGYENIRVLRRCFEKKWNYSLVLSTLEDIDRLRREGWTICADDRELIEDCRARCERHVRDEKREVRWRQLCDDLRTALRKRDATAAARILAEPEFRTREPDDESLLWRAERLINRRGPSTAPLKALPVVCAAIALVALLAFLARGSRERAFNQKCVEETEKLDALLETFDPIEQLASELRYLQSEEPDVLSDPRVFAYFDKLEKLKTENAARTNEIAALLGELQALAANDWNDADTQTIDKIERVDALLLPRDALYAQQLQKLQASILTRAETRRSRRQDQSEQYAQRLAPILTSVARRLERELPDDELASLAQKCDAAIAKWDAEYAGTSSALDARLAEPRRRFTEARARQQAVVDILVRLKAAVRAIDVITLRDHLRTAYADYAPVAGLPPLPYSADDVRDMLGNLADGLAVEDGGATTPIGIRRVFSAGKIQFDPQGRAYRRNKASIVPHVVAQSGPLYILRRAGGHLVLRRALVQHDGKWGIVSQAVKDELLLGEPLFQIH